MAASPAPFPGAEPDLAEMYRPLSCLDSPFYHKAVHRRLRSILRAIDGDTVTVEVLDTAGQDESLRLEQNIKWAEAYILMYAVTDRCSFNECSRLKFLINSYTKRQRRTSVNASEGGLQVPVALVGNQTDQSHDRMISEEEGRLKGAELSCVGFYEISVRESIEDVISIFESLYLYCRRPKKFKSKLNGIADPTAATSETSQSALPAVLPQRDRRRALQTIS